jgi:hypothetical protein
MSFLEQKWLEKRMKSAWLRLGFSAAFELYDAALTNRQFSCDILIA